MRLNSFAKGAWNRVRKVHFVGICGSGMCGIAQILKSLDYQVQGSDSGASSTGSRLKKMGIKVFAEHKADNIKGADLLVFSSAIKEDNPELEAARTKGIPLVRRAEMLAEIMRFGFGIAVSGSHGKTTTTSMLAEVLAACGEDVTLVVGGLVKSTGSSARLGEGKYVVAEADESDASFLHLHPDITIVTNIDREHLSGYAGKFDKVKGTFLEFLHNLPFYGLAILCLDNKEISSLITQIGRPYTTYGLNKNAKYRAESISQDEAKTKFDAIFPDGEKFEVHINVPGKHNVLNALACLATANELKMKRADMIAGLERFRGVARRQDCLGIFGNKQVANVMLIDDYGHHPCEIEATLNAIRGGWPNRRCNMLFQPHRYTRTSELYDEFVRVLGQVDVLFVLDIYPAGEKPVEGIDSHQLCMSLRRFGEIDPIYVKDLAELPDLLRRFLRTDDIFITQGAGSIGTIAQQLAENKLYLI